jgi:DNA-binding NtrC family response regulator
MSGEKGLVFVVDDDPSIREALESLLRSVGLGVQTFASAQDFITSKRPNVPGCLVLDVHLPGLSGFDLQEAMLKVEISLPIVFITGRGDIPMSVRAMKAGALEFLTKPFHEQDLLDAIAQGIARDRRARQQRDFTPERNFEDIVGASSALKDVLKLVEVVAPTGSGVLILGETGTGKELIARAIHNISPRANRPFVKINCAAIPSGLLESELFGHEKGAFTGAIARATGRFELAHEGTLFLDEVGDTPPELQPKLLRVLQEHTFERLGSTRTQRVDVRLVAATNRNLAEMVARKEFRNDLYFRLNVFPIRMPPLRERAEDIPLLAHHFVRQYAQQMNKPVADFSDAAMDRLCRYGWPGNIREMQNFIERTMILSTGGPLRPPLAELDAENETATVTAETLDDAERRHILKILQNTKWVIGGPKGAALQLGLKRTTLLSKMERLGISRQS